MARIGVDIVDLAEVRTSLARFGDRFADRLLTPLELEGLPTREEAAVAYVSVVLAAKEAVTKLMGPLAPSQRWHEIEICGVHDAWSVTLRGGAAEAAATVGVAQVSLAVTVTTTHALVVAFGT